MDEWEGHFANKSENRRRRSKRRRLIRRTLLVACVSLTILAGLWVVDRMTNGVGLEKQMSITRGPRR
jgi:ferric-dicitrate binding protein FerR (iron transport regulator)